MAKKKGLDGKACWKGYKLMGTKKKGGRTVDNCVKMSHGGELHGGQTKLDKNKNGRLDGEDFKMMSHGGDVFGNSNRRRFKNG